MQQETQRGGAPFAGQIFENVFDQAPIGMCLCAADGRLLRVNDGLAKICGGTPRELIGHGLGTLVHPDDRPAIPLFSRSGPPDAIEIRSRTSSGEVRWLRLRITRLSGEETEAKYLCVVDDFSAQKSQEESLRASDATKRAILEALPDMLLVVDRDERFLDFHAPNQADLYLPSSEFLGKSIREVLPEPTASLCSELVGNVFRTGLLQTADYSLPLHGSIQFFQCRAVRCARGILVIVQNITNYRQTLNAVRASEDLLRQTNERLEQVVHERTVHLQHSEERYRRIVEDQTELIARWNFTEQVTFVNGAVCRYLNLPVEEILHRSFLPFVHEDDVSVVQAHLSALTADSPVGLVEHRVRLPSGEIRWTKWTNRAFFDVSGQCVEYQSVGRDITERKQAESERARLEHERRLAQEAVVASERQLRQILDALFGFVGVYTVDGTLIDANRAPLEVAGLTHQDVLGKPFWETYWWNYDPKVQADLRDALTRAARGEVVRYEPTVRILDGKLIDIDCTFCPLRDSNGAISGIVGFAVDVTERKQNAARSREQARLLDLIFEHSLDGIVLLDKDYNFVRVNRAYARVCRRELSEFAGKNHFDLYPSPLKEEFDEAIRRRIIFQQHARPFVFPDHPEWGVTYWDLGMVPIRDPSGDPELLLFTLRDVTEQKRAEEGLHDSEARWQAFIDHATDAFFIHDAEDDGRVVDVNRQACEGLGYSREELIGQFPAHFDTSIIEAKGADLGLRINAGQTVVFDTYHRRKDGTMFPVAVRIRPFSLQGKRYAMALVRDITERHRTEQLLRESQERLAGLVESAMDAIVCVDEQQQVILFNRAAEKLFGIAAVDVVGHPIDRLIPASSRSIHAQRIREFGLTGTTSRAMGKYGTVHGLRADGSTFPMEASISQVTVGGAKVYTAILRDITDRIRAEENLRQSLSDKDALLKEVHHRVKNNLQIVNSLLNLQASKIKDATIRAMFADTQNRVRSMALVHETLVRSGTLASVNLAGYLESLCTQLFRAFGANPRQTRLQLEIAKSEIDLERAIPCGLIVNELVSNALKHAFPNERPGNIRVALDRVGNRNYTLIVADDGIGIPAESDCADTLGLQLIQDLAQQLGAVIACERTGGTTYRITFPIEPPK